MAFLFQAVSSLTAERDAAREHSETSRKELEQRLNKSSQMLEMQSKVEGDLRRQLGDLNEKLSSAMVGRQSESEMYAEAMSNATRLEKTVTELNAKVRNIPAHAWFCLTCIYRFFTR